VFSKQAIKELMSQYVLVQLYTDQVPPRFKDGPTAKENRDFQARYFKNSQLPLYVILRPDSGAPPFQEVARYEEGKINNESAFTDFLKRPLASLVAENRAHAESNQQVRAP
jgi:hypothetical protein